MFMQSLKLSVLSHRAINTVIGLLQRRTFVHFEHVPGTKNLSKCHHFDSIAIRKKQYDDLYYNNDVPHHPPKSIFNKVNQKMMFQLVCSLTCRPAVSLRDAYKVFLVSSLPLNEKSKMNILNV